MSQPIKPVRVWCVVAPGDLLTYYVDRTRREAIDTFVRDSEVDWRELRSYGYRVVRCRLVPEDADG